MKTRFTELFGIKYPIMLAGMNRITTPELVAAVSNAGGLGNHAISAHNPDKLRADIKKIRELTDKPFAVNQILMSPSAKANLNVVIGEKVPIVNYTLGRPPEIVPLIKAVHSYGGKVIATVAQVKHAARAEELGADAINVTGHEAAAHGGYVTSLVLIPLVADSIKVPFIAAGGFFDGRGLTAALALGADGILMGTRFAVTKECALHDNWKQTFIKASELDTLYIDVGNPAVNGRVYKNKYAEGRMKKRSPLKESISGALATKRLLNLSWWELISSGMRSSKGEGSMSMRQQLRYAASAAREHKVMFEGDLDAGIISIGQVLGGIRDIPTCKELIERIVIQAEQTMDIVHDKTRA